MAANSAPSDRRLTLARGVWFVVVTLALGLFLLSIPLQSSYLAAQISPAGLEQLRQAGLSLGFYAGYNTALNTVHVLVSTLVAAVIFWRKSDDWMGIFSSLAFVLISVTNDTTALTPVAQQYPPLRFLIPLLSFLGVVAIFLFFYLFPDGRFVPRWVVWLVPLVVVNEALNIFRPDLLGQDWFLPVELASILLAQIDRYFRVASAVQRQQTKWVVYGTTVAIGGMVCTFLYSAIASQQGQPSPGISDLIGNMAWDSFSLLIPLSIGMAILRSHLWDIDVLIRRTLIYAVLTALLAAIYLGAVVALQAVFTALTGQQRSEVVTVISTLVIAALFVPLRNRIQAVIDRRLYRGKYDAARTLAQFGAALRNEVDLDDLSSHLLAAVDETMRPESVALWLVKPPLKSAGGLSLAPVDRTPVEPSGTHRER